MRRHLGFFSLFQDRDCLPFAVHSLHSRYISKEFAVAYDLISSPSVVGLWGIFGIDTNTPIPFSLALVTNFLLLGLTGTSFSFISRSSTHAEIQPGEYGKGRQATVVLGVQAGRRYNRTLEIM
jgi:hypothetical protein